jgi:prepilin-type processing-associated H-X9-DG protein
MAFLNQQIFQCPAYGEKGGTTPSYSYAINNYVQNKPYNHPNAIKRPASILLLGEGKSTLGLDWDRLAITADVDYYRHASSSNVLFVDIHVQTVMPNDSKWSTIDIAKGYFRTQF